MQGGCYTPNQLFHLGGCVVVVEKKTNCLLRLCGDFLEELNRAFEFYHYPLPRSHNLVAKLNRS